MAPPAPPCRRLLVLALVAVASPVLTPGAEALREERLVLGSGGRGEVVHLLPGAPVWDPTRALSSVRVSVECGDGKGGVGYRPGFKVFHGGSREEVEAQAREDRRLPSQVWGSWLGGTGESRAWEVGVSPYKDTFISVVQPAIGAMGAGPFHCVVTRQEAFMPWRLWCVVLGIFLLARAVPLSDSVWFRLASGATLSVIAFGVLLLYFLGKQMPGKLPLVLLLSSGTAVGLASFAGAWMPTWEEILLSTWFLAYMGTGATVGVVCTYIYFDPSDMSPRAVDCLHQGIRAGGVVALAGGCQLLWLSATLGAATLAWPIYSEALMRACRRALGAAGARLPTKEAQPPSPPDVAEELSSTPRTPAQARPGGSASAPHHEPEHSLVKSGKVLNLSSGRAIKIGGETFNRLVEQGYDFDRREGVLSPPPTKALNFSPPKSSSPLTRDMARRRLASYG